MLVKFVQHFLRYLNVRHLDWHSRQEHIHIHEKQSTAQTHVGQQQVPVWRRSRPAKGKNSRTHRQPETIRTRSRGPDHQAVGFLFLGGCRASDGCVGAPDTRKNYKRPLFLSNYPLFGPTTHFLDQLPIFWTIWVAATHFLVQITL